MKRMLLVVLAVILALMLTACDTTPKYREYESLGTITGELTYTCPRCGTNTLKVASGKSYGICSRCDEKYFIK